MLNILNKIRSFAQDKSGAVTVDWVALTAAIVVIGIGLVYAIFGDGNGNGVGGLVTSLTTSLGEAAGDVAQVQADNITGTDLNPTNGS